MYKLLVVDDEAETRSTLCSCFPWEQLGFRVEAERSNGMEALKYILQQPVDVLLCDIKMPVMNGIELAKEIANRKLPIRIVLLSGLRDFEYARQAINCGVSHYLVKPAKFNDIFTVLTELKIELDQEAKHSNSDMPLEHNELILEGQDDPVIQKIISFIEMEYRTVTLEESAKHVHMNPTYVSAYFKKMTGCKFSEYVQSVKMKKAAVLLKDRRFKAFEVSEMVGYANAKNFIRSFKQFYGKTPGQYRHEGHFPASPH
ncbi:response regulator transcription factor [Paenibacillus radicis (ex Xue et al. 2023)]|uniref:Response regulator n=1 Tax=Paenibacillus radicis (ex Xue et al. 2023) TaxID=2972489 RepID=A0ABT1YKL8_9BACL|nr:response regulator [Paenibacillus radicis (ex Xue et al. 2023)]MCR8633737.1 response regulator [Paenibacillus radicis (ex Xue et al. 2023)]